MHTPHTTPGQAATHNKTVCAAQVLSAMTASYSLQVRGLG